MTEGPASFEPQSGGVAMSVPEPPSPGPRPPRRWLRWPLLVLAVLGTLWTVAFEVRALTSDRSLDAPFFGNVRPGFFGNGWPVRWTCPEGHDHWSLPYWSGTLVMTGLSVLLWRAWWRRRPPATP